MIIHLSTSYRKSHKKLVKNNTSLRLHIKQKLQLFERSSNHPSLRLHKLAGTHREEWSISITGSIRIIFQYIPEGILLTYIGSHDEVY